MSQYARDAEQQISLDICVTSHVQGNVLRVMKTDIEIICFYGFSGLRALGIGSFLLFRFLGWIGKRGHGNIACLREPLASGNIASLRAPRQERRGQHRILRASTTA